MNVDIFGYFAAILTTAAFLPQLIKTLKTKKAITDLTMGEVGDIKSYSPTYITEILQIWGMFEELE